MIKWWTGLGAMVLPCHTIYWITALSGSHSVVCKSLSLWKKQPSLLAVCKEGVDSETLYSHIHASTRVTFIPVYYFDSKCSEQQGLLNLLLVSFYKSYSRGLVYILSDHLGLFCSMLFSCMNLWTLFIHSSVEHLSYLVIGAMTT